MNELAQLERLLEDCADYFKERARDESCEAALDLLQRVGQAQGFISNIPEEPQPEKHPIRLEECPECGHKGFHDSNCPNYTSLEDMSV